MSTRDIAHNIINNLSEEQLKGFIALFNGLNIDVDSSSDSRNEAFDKLMALRHSAPDFDEEKEYNDYLDERYGA